MEAEEDPVDREAQEDREGPEDREAQDGGIDRPRHPHIITIIEVV